MLKNLIQLILLINCLIELVYCQQDNPNQGSLAIIQSKIESAGIIPDIFDRDDLNNLKGLFSVKFNGQDEPVEPGQMLDKDATQSKPEFKFIPAVDDFDAQGNYTIALIDADYNGADLSEGVNRHFLENYVEVNDESNKDQYDLSKDGKIIQSYAGPGPSEGSGAHRYNFLLLKQPQDFQAPEGLDNENTPMGKMSISDYIDSTNSEIVAINFFYVQNGESTVSNEKPTSTINSASVSSSALASPSASDANNEQSEDNDEEGDSSSINLSYSVITLNLALIPFVFLV